MSSAAQFSSCDAPKSEGSAKKNNVLSILDFYQQAAQERSARPRERSCQRVAFSVQPESPEQFKSTRWTAGRVWAWRILLATSWMPFNSRNEV